MFIIRFLTLVLLCFVVRIDSFGAINPVNHDRQTISTIQSPEVTTGTVRTTHLAGNPPNRRPASSVDDEMTASPALLVASLAIVGLIALRRVTS